MLCFRAPSSSFSLIHLFLFWCRRSSEIRNGGRQLFMYFKPVYIATIIAGDWKKRASEVAWLRIRCVVEIILHLFESKFVHKVALGNAYYCNLLLEFNYLHACSYYP